nr:zinc-ribbon domain-containing protein [Candidatus Baldrarchaeota archaeon]
MLRCPRCGKEVSEDFNYCPYCGQKIPRISTSDVRIIQIKGEKVVELDNIQIIEGGTGIYFLIRNVHNFPIRIENIDFRQILPKPKEKKVFFGLLRLRKETGFMGGLIDVFGGKKILPGEEHPIKIYTVSGAGTGDAVFSSYSGKIIQRGFKYLIEICGRIIVGKVTGAAHPITIGAEVTRTFSIKYTIEY